VFHTGSAWHSALHLCKMLSIGPGTVASYKVGLPLLSEMSGFGKEEGTKYTKSGPGAPGGTSWTVEWLKFDNSYFK
jgi:hypothetical protein